MAEQIQDGFGPANPQSQLIVLSNVAAVPEPGSAALMMLGGVGLFCVGKRRPTLKA